MELISWGLHSSLEKERKFRRHLFTSIFMSWSCSNGKEMYKKGANLLFCLINVFCWFVVLVAVTVVFAKNPSDGKRLEQIGEPHDDDDIDKITAT